MYLSLPDSQVLDHVFAFAERDGDAGGCELFEDFARTPRVFVQVGQRRKKVVAGREIDEAEPSVSAWTRGLQPPDLPVSVELIEEFAETDIAAGDARYREPLERDVHRLAARLAPHSRVVLLGSIASDKYVDVLRPLLGPRLHYPIAFVGRGDMSRGGLLLRQADSGEYL